MTVDSKTVSCQASAEKIYNFLSDFNNFTHLIPSKVEGWSVVGNTCTFKVAGFMQLTLTYDERTPYQKIVIVPAANSGSPVPFRMNVNIVDDGANSSRVNLSFNLDGNPMMTMMLKPKLREAADKLVEQLAYFSAGL